MKYDTEKESNLSVGLSECYDWVAPYLNWFKTESEIKKAD